MMIMIMRAATAATASLAVGRFLNAGSVLYSGLACVLSSPRWAEASAGIPGRTGPTACHPDCQPSNSDSCDPGKNDPCDPMGYAPAAPGSPAAAVPALL
ncbi:hypothetical protein AB0953_31140 [Streptomyces sp. NPDC046866]|uniref:hypothetical protein n=1 Tax=Streptomyces sp. NPDC046866 TaxID=3154921 RepID=UPI0034555A20